MSEKNFNTLLYVLLAISIILYFSFNMPDMRSAYLAREPGYALTGAGPDTSGADSHADCSCSGPEWIYADESGSGSGDKGEDLREDASSVYTEEKPKETKHNVSAKGWHLYIDLDEKLMYVYKDGELVKGTRYPAANPVRLGWHVEDHKQGHLGRRLRRRMSASMYPGASTAYMGPRSRGLSANSLKGCIRMRNRRPGLYRLVPHNTLVTVVHENRPFYPMRDGDVGSDVLAVERALKKLGYYHGGEDGIFGSSLKKAVMEFQRDNRLYATGVVNNSTYERIMELEKEYDAEQERLKKEREERRKKLEQELE